MVIDALNTNAGISAGDYVVTRYDDHSVQVVPLARAGNFLKETRYFTILQYQNPSIAKPGIKYYTVQKPAIVQVNNSVLKENEPIRLKSGLSKQDYIRKIKLLKEEIQKGNIYEINYCIEFYAQDVEIDPLSVYLKLEELTKAPFSRLVKDGDNYIICASPELFLKKENDVLYTKPIKGTIRRGESDKEDEELKDQLFHSEKERTENVMAVDVARNDLSRIAKRGTVSVNKLYNIESYQTVHQMVSTVSCQVSTTISFQSIIDATFPMASMTGAPKIRAMELIDSAENFRRNYYSGAMGFIEENGDFELAVTIRSIFYNEHNKRVSIAVGSAITHLCDPELEYEECLLKAGALLKALNAETESI